MSSDPLEGPKNFPRSFAARKTFFGPDTAPPPQAQKPSYGPALANPNGFRSNS